MKKAILITLTAAIAAFTAFTGIGSCKDGKWYQEPDVAKWYNSRFKGNVISGSGAAETVQPIAYTSDGVIAGGGTYALPATMTLAAAEPEYLPESRTFTLTAAFSLKYVSVSYSWSVAYADKQLSGQQVTNYLRITPSPDGTSATVEYIQPFNRTIVITVTADVCGVKYTSDCKVDCLRPIIPGAADDLLCQGFYMDSYAAIDTHIYYGTGTVNGEIEFKRLELSLKPEFKACVQNALSFPIEFRDYTGTSLPEPVRQYDGSLWFGDYYYDLFTEGYDGYTEEQQEEIADAWYYGFFAAADGDPYYNNLNVEMELDYTCCGQPVTVGIRKSTNVEGAE